MYSEKVLDHFQHPRNMGEIEGYNGMGMVGNAKCGDIMQMFIRVNDEGITKTWALRPSAAAPLLRRAPWLPK